MTTTAVLPVKQLAHAKQRLRGLLSSEERTLLFRSMVEDVLVAVEVSPLIDEILMVTSDSELGDLAYAFGATVMQDEGLSGLIDSVSAAANRLGNSINDTLVYIPGDVPLVAPEDLEIVLDGFGSSSTHEITLVPADDFGGTNCIACTPPNCLEFCFGKNSFRRHLETAKCLRITPAVLKLTRIGLDIDTPSDLIRLSRLLYESYQEKVTFRYLLDSGILEKFCPEFLGITRK